MTTKIIKKEEFEKHHFRNDCWIEIDGKVYDVSQWMLKHPGGERVIESLGGKDASLPFLLNHHPSVRKYLPSMYIGDLEPKPKRKYDALTKDFKKLYHKLLEEGWFNTRYGYYMKKVWVLAMMMLGITYLFSLTDYYGSCIFAVIASVMTGMFWQQIAFIGHDLGHNGITHSVFWDTVLGLIFGNLGQGISGGWWKYTHNVHHIRTNDEEWDPDIQHMPFIAISVKYLKKVFSKFHRQVLPPTDTFSQKLASITIPYQKYHWFITIMSSRLFLYMSSFIFCFYQQPFHLNGRNEPFPGYNLLEMITLIGYHVWTISLFYFCTDSPLFYYLIAYMVSGILHIQIIMNHFPCPVVDGIEEENFIVHQLRTSMAISSNTYTHWFYGGLQFQVEHHLFPMMPRHNLRKVKPYILKLCKQYDIPYLENTFWGAVSDIHKVLEDVSAHSHKLNDLRFETKAN